MTAIKEFERLEALGLWKENSSAQRKEVVISFGDASLVLSDLNSRPIVHWSMAAIRTVDQTETGRIYSADADGEETLEIEDPTMIAAIQKITTMIELSRPHPGRLRWLLSAGFVLVVLGLAFFWLPNAVTKYAANVIPDAKAQEIGNALVRSISKTTGSGCSTPSGQRALRRFEDRVIRTSSNRIIVAEMGSKPSLHLPGGNIMLNHRLINENNEPNILAGYALLERAAEDETSPLETMFSTIGFRETMRFLTSGEITAEALEKVADKQLFGPASQPSSESLKALFEVAEIPRSSFAKTANRMDIMDGEDLASDQYDPLMSDADWIALQEICNR